MLTRRFYSIKEFRHLSGLGLTKIYALLAEGRLRAVKLDRRTLVEAEHADRFLGNLPRGKFHTGLTGRRPQRAQESRSTRSTATTPKRHVAQAGQRASQGHGGA